MEKRRKRASISEREINNLIMTIKYINKNHLGKLFKSHDLFVKNEVYSPTYTMRALHTYLKESIEIKYGKGIIIKNKISEEPLFARKVLEEAKKMASEYNSKKSKERYDKRSKNSNKKEQDYNFEELNIISYEGIKLIEATIHLGGYEINGTFILKPLNNEEKK